MSFKGIEAGSRVTFKMYAGRGVKGPEYQSKTCKVNAMLIFDTHVVVNLGGRHGMPQVVDEKNYISHKPGG